MLFLLTLSALESKCKDTKIFPYGKKYFITGLFYTIFSNKHRYKQKKYMPELFRAFGYVFMFFSLEHKPIHVHVVGNDGDAKFEWNGSEFILKEKHNIKPSDMRKIKQMVDDNADIIVSRWNDFFKEVRL